MHEKEASGHVRMMRNSCKYLHVNAFVNHIYPATSRRFLQLSLDLCLVKTQLPISTSTNQLAR